MLTPVHLLVHVATWVRPVQTVDATGSLVMTDRAMGNLRCRIQPRVKARVTESANNVELNADIPGDAGVAFCKPADDVLEQDRLTYRGRTWIVNSVADMDELNVLKKLFLTGKDPHGM